MVLTVRWVSHPASARSQAQRWFCSARFSRKNSAAALTLGDPQSGALFRIASLNSLARIPSAHSEGVKVAAHAIGDAPTRIAAEAGVDSIEHAYTVPDDVLAMMAQKHIFLVPTDMTVKTFEEMMLGDRTPSPEEKAYLDKRFKGFEEGQISRLQRAIKAGVPIAYGSDMYLSMWHKTRGQASLLTFDSYTAAGMSPMDIIRAATSNAAELLGLKDRLGSIEAGKWADIIAVLGDPLKDVSVLQHARFVMKGRVVIKNER